MNALDLTAIDTCLSKISKGVVLKTFSKELAVSRLETVSKYPIAAMAHYGYLLQKITNEDFDKLVVALSQDYPTRSSFDHDKDKGDKTTDKTSMPVSAISFFLNRKESIYRKAMPELPGDDEFITDVMMGKYDSILTDDQHRVKELLPKELKAKEKAETLAKKLEKDGYTIKRVSQDTVIIVIPPTMADHIAKFGNGEYSPDDKGFIVNVAVE